MKPLLITIAVLITFNLVTAQSTNHKLNFGYNQNYAVGEWNIVYTSANEIYAGYEYKTSNHFSILSKASYLFLNESWVPYDRHDIHFLVGLKYYLNSIQNGLYSSGMLGLSLIRAEDISRKEKEKYDKFNFNIELGYELPLNETINLDIHIGYNSTRFNDFKNDFLLFGIGTSINL
jgi:hypothetical protein